MPGPGVSDFTGLAINGALIDSINANSPVEIRNPLARIIYVRSIGGNGDSTGFGTGVTPQEPYSTLAAAIASIASRTTWGDLIYCLPGHVESVSAADYFSAGLTAANYSIVGLGRGTNRPTFNWTAAASTWLLDTAGVSLNNLILNFAVTAATVVVTPMTVSAANCSIRNCYINWGISTTIGCGSTLGAIALTTAADYFEFTGNFCNNLDVAGTTGQAICLLSINGADYMKIVGNKIFGATTVTTVGPIHFLTTLSSDVEIAWNYVENLIASSTIAISSAIAGVTGTIAYNQLRVNSGIQAITVSTNISCSLFQNFTNNTVNKNGALTVGSGTSA